ncbi:uncharacterized protein K444DRAFT_623175 [Hyaloscypha bicolor E]|uniref:DUF7371 domain-containing protein n=1 Tax=Hyaloscypha bicolor E TaxID=1095630 RepID=A0A2J6TV87_9HELO|nr:uncharacterized protein K444DRAFT_623175 [Hyaloscypha bicolor E]PMD66927.1 hypothetical protein K444DRAFT_623175 [Hyaloscypha bicolor E]
MGMLAFVALVASAPAVSYGPPASLCAPTTVFVTISSLSTVTIYNPSPETTYVTRPCSSETDPGTPTTTLTRHSTLVTTAYPQVDTILLTTPVRASTQLPENAATTEAPNYVATITETTILVITNVQLTPYQSGGHLTYSETAAPNGLLQFVVENGTTYWLNGQTPAPSQSYMIQTSVVTVEPVPEASATSDETSTVHLTRYSTQKFTITEALSSSSAARAASSHTEQPTTKSLSTSCLTSTASSYIATGSTFTGIGAGGWNATSTTRSGSQSGAIGSPSTLSLMPLLPSQPLSLATTFSLLSLTSLAAQSGFNAFSTSSALGSASTPGGTYTSTIVPPYANTTSPASRSSPYSGSAVQSASNSFPSSYSASQVFNSTTVKPSYTTVPVPASTTTPSSTSLNQTSTSASSAASATSSNCGEYGDFTLTFDDIPPLSVSNPNPDDVQPEPVFNPYHQFDFSDGFVVVPPPRSPYLPSSKPLFTEFIPNFNINGTNPMAGPTTAEYGYSGDIGNGDHGLTGCFSFNMYGASFGCDSRGPDCVFHFTGYRYNRSTRNTTAVTSQSISVPACPALASCTLTPITLDNSFSNLDSIRINVTVGSAPKIWWMDDLRLGWFDNSCKAGLCRVSTPIH